MTQEGDDYQKMKAEIDQAAAGIRDMAPFLANMIRVLTDEGLKSHEAAMIVGAWLAAQTNSNEAQED